jgi:hypothetical protein
MKFKLRSLSEVWKDTKIYGVGLLAALGLVVGSVFTYQNVIKPISSTFAISEVKATGDDDKNKTDMSYSFYEMTTWLSAYYNAASSPTGYKTLEEKPGHDYDYHTLLTESAIKGAKAETGKDEWTYADYTWVNGSNKKIGGGGALLGFPDKSVIKGGGILGFLSSQTSSSTVDYSYDSLGSGNTYNSLETYAYYGAALDALGIDSSMTSVMSFHPIRMFAGAVVWLGYIIASGAELLFKLAISILQVTNPFNWFAKGFNYTWTNADEKGMFSALTNTVSGLYKLFAEFGWTVMIPLTIAIWIFMFIFTGNGRQNQTLTKSKAEKFRYFIVYFLFLAVGVPVMGTAYTAGLDALSETFNKDNVGNGGVGVDAIIYSAYIDNKAWIENNRLYLPSDVDLTWDTSISDVPYQNKAKVRQYALSINSLNHLDLKKATDNGSADNSWNLSNKQTGDSKTSEGVNTILLRYMLGESYLPSDWETKVKSYLSEAAGRGDSEDSKKPGSLVNRLNASATELTSKEGYKYIAYVNPHVQDGDPETWGVEVNEGWFGLGKTYRFGQYPNIFLSRGYADEGNGGFIAKNSSGAPGSSSKSDRLNFESNPNATVKQGMVYGNTKATMSYLEMFNYLNSKFTATKVRVYSTNTLTSNFSRESHAAVNQVGAGYVHKFMIWINTVTLLFGVAFLAVGYAVGMVVASFKRYINLVTSIFLGTLGMQKGMVKAASATIMLIFEVVGTIVIYELAKTIYIAIPDILSNAISGLNNGSKVTSTALTNIGFSAGAANMGGFVLVIFSLMLSVIVLVWMLLMLLRLRKPIIDMADSTFTTMIGKLFYADGSLGHGDDTKGESGGMTNAISAVSGFVAGNSSSNIEGAEGDDNDGYVAGDESSTETNGGNGAEDEQGEKPDPNSKKANSKETEGIGEKVKSEGGIDRNGQESASESEQPEGTNGEQPSSGAPSANESSSGSGSSKGSESVSGAPSSNGSGESEQGTFISDDDTVNVSTAEGGSESGKGSSGKGSKSSGTKSSGSSGKNDEVSASSESPKQTSSDVLSEIDSPSELSERGLSEASKVSASSDSGKQSSGDGSEQEVFGPSIATVEGGQGLSKSNGGLSSGESGKQQGSNQISKTPTSKSNGGITPSESGKQQGGNQTGNSNAHSVKSNGGLTASENGKQQGSNQNSKTPTAKSNGGITPSESGKQQGSNQTNVSSAPISKASQHMEQAKQNLSSAKDSAKQAGSSEVTASKQAVSGVRDVASGISGVVSGQQSISSGASQVASGAKQMVQSVSSAGNAIINGASTVSQSASAISNATKSAASAVGSSAVVSQASRIGNSVAKGVTTAANTQLGQTLINTALDRSSSPVSSSGSTQQRQTSQSTGSSGQQQTVLRQSSAGSGSNGGQTIVRNQSNLSNDNRTSNSRNTSMMNRPSSSGSIPKQNASGNGGQSLDRPQSGSVSTGTNTSAPTSGIKRVANTTGKVVKATAKGMMATGEKLDPVGRHIENELKKSIGDMAPTSSASSNGLDADFMERSHLAEMERLRRRNRTTRPR